ncbi:hypothetical protein C0Q70_09531 [Pomacea canaliculata]|uniref:receptor protein-tyrosine kinase n=1 Tax=Pomacea canaliculata TaxID=400727 RepID=A0A2T7PA29_POMCA|nr:hypothetical protein C0Q70_09531 [Pomacea canaliculata]
MEAKRAMGYLPISLDLLSEMAFDSFMPAWSRGYDTPTVEFLDIPKQAVDAVLSQLCEPCGRPIDCEVPDEAPYFYKEPLSQLRAAEGGRVKFRCKVKGEPRPFLVWYRNNELITPHADDRIIITKYALSIDPVNVNDTGKYSCLAKNQFGEKWANFTLSVEADVPNPEPTAVDNGRDSDEEGPPQWSYRMTDIKSLTRTVNSFVDLKCLAKGYPTPNITWLKDGGPFHQSKMGNVNMKGWRLTIGDLMPEDEGKYTCVITNQYGSINWTFVVEIILLTCKIILSDFHPHLQWVKHYQVNGSYKSPSGDPYLRVIQSATVNNSNPEQLILSNVSMEDAGWYTCLVANAIGMEYGSAWLTVVKDREMLLPRTGLSSDNASLGNAGGFIYEDPRFIGGVAAIFIVAVVICLGVAICCWNRQRRQRMLQPQKPLKRVIIMKPNDLYYPKKDPDAIQPLVVPQVRIDYKPGRHRLSSEFTDVSEYDLPLDTKWEFPRERLVLGDRLGEGAFGLVVKGEAFGIFKDNNSVTVAVKMLKEGSTDREMMDLIREMEMMKLIGKHKNIINLLGCCTQRGPLYVVVEFAPNGNLRDYLKSHRPLGSSFACVSEYERPTVAMVPNNSGSSIAETKEQKALTPKDLISYAYQVARGMEYLASRQCIHRDLAARNVLVAEEYVLKIADFGLTRNLQQFDYYKKTTDGRLPVKWMAPEALFDRKYTSKSDVYAIMHSCWQEDPNNRPDFNRLVQELDKILTSSLKDEAYLDLEPMEGPMSTSDSQYSSMSHDSTSSGDNSAIV